MRSRGVAPRVVLGVAFCAVMVGCTPSGERKVKETDASLQYEIDYGKDPVRVVALSPENGSDKVDAAVGELVVEFDRAVRGDRYSLCRQDDEGEFPEPGDGAPRYENGGRRLVVPVKLKAATRYALAVNCEGFSLIEDEGGNRVKPTPWRFRTAKGSGEVAGKPAGESEKSGKK